VYAAIARAGGTRIVGIYTYIRVRARVCVASTILYARLCVPRGCSYVNIARHTVPSSFLLDCRYRPLAS
jgi:hypothetical protein